MNFVSDGVLYCETFQYCEDYVEWARQKTRAEWISDSIKEFEVFENHEYWHRLIHDGKVLEEAQHPILVKFRNNFTNAQLFSLFASVLQEERKRIPNATLLAIEDMLKHSGQFVGNQNKVPEVDTTWASVKSIPPKSGRTAREHHVLLHK